MPSNAFRGSRIPTALALGFFVALGLPSSLLGQQHMALISQFRGDVKVVQAAGGGELPARVGLRLHAGDRVDVARGSRAVLLFNNGRLVTATTPLTVAPVGGAGAAEVYDRAARALAAAERLERPKESGGVGRPPPAVAYPLAPGFGSAVLAQHPTFSWQLQEGTESYLVQIRPAAGGAPIRFQVAEAGSWTMPDTAAPLQRGGEYLWTVVALPGGRIAGEARFRVMDDADVAAVAAFHAALEEAGVDPQGDGLLVAAMFYADIGLLHEAAAALERLMAETSESERDPVVDLLHAQVLGSLGRTSEAAEAFERAGRGSDDGVTKEQR